MLGKETSHLQGGMSLVAFYRVPDNNVIKIVRERHIRRGEMTVINASSAQYSGH